MPDEQQSDYCDRKARFWRVKAARKSARTAGALFSTSFDIYPCRKHGCFHLATSRPLDGEHVLRPTLKDRSPLPRRSRKSPRA